MRLFSILSNVHVFMTRLPKSIDVNDFKKLFIGLIRQCAAQLKKTCHICSTFERCILLRNAIGSLIFIRLMSIDDLMATTDDSSTHSSSLIN